MAKRKTIKEISLKQVEYVAHSLAQELMTWNEPIPAFNTRYKDRLESCLKTPFQKFNKQSLYRGLVSKAGILFYFMIKNHPFQNGNKRVAVMTLLFLLRENNKWLSVDANILYQFAVRIAESNPSDKDKVVKGIRSFIRKYLVQYEI